MTVGSGGVEYENKVLNVLRPQIKNMPSFAIKESTAAFSASEPDLVLMYNNRQQINIEIKQDSKAQMGGGSYNYDMNKKEFFLTGKADIDPSLNDQIVKLLGSTISDDLDKLLKFVSERDARVIAEKVKGLPLKATKRMWELLVKERLLIPLNKSIPTSQSFIHDHYAKKSCYYIQIGGAGLFYLKNNPLGLPIPQLNTGMNIELRLGRGGSVFDRSVGENTASGNIRAQGRLIQFSSKSPYSLDKDGDFTKLFSNIKIK
jgi:hypothetical protein